MSSLTRRMQRSATRLNRSGLIHFGDKIGVTNPVVKKGTKPKTWRSGRG